MVRKWKKWLINIEYWITMKYMERKWEIWKSLEALVVNRNKNNRREYNIKTYRVEIENLKRLNLSNQIIYNKSLNTASIIRREKQNS